MELKDIKVALKKFPKDFTIEQARNWIDRKITEMTENNEFLKADYWRSLYDGYFHITTEDYSTTDFYVHITRDLTYVNDVNDVEVGEVIELSRNAESVNVRKSDTIESIYWLGNPYIEVYNYNDSKIDKITKDEFDRIVSLTNETIDKFKFN